MDFLTAVVRKRSRLISQEAHVRLLSHPLVAAALLVVLILSVYLPFSFDPVLRPSGDDKVYIAQVIEMLRDGRWFEQTLADQPNYYKGPIFYILLRISMMMVSVHSTFATVLPNLLATLFGSVAIFFFVVRERLPEKSAILIGFAAAAAFAFSFGIYPFVFAAQMEVLLSAAYVAVTILMIKSMRRGSFWAVWSVIGATGWIKSPVHSVLCGLALLTAVVMSGHAWQLRAPRFWAAAAIGVLVGVAGYLPPFLNDHHNFWATYIVRETATKGPNGVSVWSAVMPALTYFQFPFGPFLWAGALVGLHDGGWRIWAFCRTYAVELAIVLTNLIFFAWHPYRSEIYCLPLIGPLLLMAARAWNRGAKHLVIAHAAGGLKRMGTFIASLFAGVMALPGIGVLTGVTHFEDNVATGVAVFAILSFAVFVALTVLQRRRPDDEKLFFGIVALIPVYLSTGLFMRELGRWDLNDLKAAAAESEFGFWNLDRRTWSEWGAMNAWLGRPVTGLHEPSELLRALKSGVAVYAPHATALESVRSIAGTAGIDCCLSVRSVRRFRIAGGGRGIEWKSVLLNNEWSRVMTEAYIVSHVPSALMGEQKHEWF